MPGCRLALVRSGMTRTRSPAANLCVVKLNPPRGWNEGRRGRGVPRPSAGLQIDRRKLALLAPLERETDALPLVQRLQPGPLHRGDVDEHVLAAVIGLDEAVALLFVE